MPPIASGLSHLSDLGQWNVSKQNMSGGLLGTYAMELVHVEHSFLESRFWASQKPKQLCGEVYTEKNRGARVQSQLNSQPSADTNSQSQGPMPLGISLYPSIPAPTVFPSRNTFGNYTLISVACSPLHTNYNRHNKFSCSICNAPSTQITDCCRGIATLWQLVYHRFHFPPGCWLTS